MPNVNELHRQAWEEYQQLELDIFNKRLPKSDKEHILRRMNELEKELDIESVPYNSTAFIERHKFADYNWNGDPVDNNPRTEGRYLTDESYHLEDTHNAR